MRSVIKSLNKKTKQVKAEFNSLQAARKHLRLELAPLYSMFQDSEIREISFDL
jgi:hypothetical protein